jgi:hypothetical protein
MSMLTLTERQETGLGVVEKGRLGLTGKVFRLIALALSFGIED